jgi:hypothetical protein
MEFPFFSNPPFFFAHPMAPAFPPNFFIPAFMPSPFAFPSFAPPPPPPSTIFCIGQDEQQPDEHPADLAAGDAEAEALDDSSTPAFALIPPPAFSAAVHKAAPKDSDPPSKQKTKKEAPARSLADTSALELHRLLMERELESHMSHMRQGKKTVIFVLPSKLACGQGVILVQRAFDNELADESTPLHRATYQKLAESISQNVESAQIELWVKFFRNKGKVCVKATVSWKR